MLMAEYSPVAPRFLLRVRSSASKAAPLAAMVFVYLGTIPEDVLLGWAWRVPFLASILLILVALFIRMRLKESPTFIELEKHEQIAEHPLQEIFGRSSAAFCAASGCGWPRTAARTCSTPSPWRTPRARSWSTGRSARSPLRWVR